MGKGFRNLYDSAIFKVEDAKSKEIKFKKFTSEDKLQRLLENNIDILGGEISLLESQYHIKGIGKIDLLCLDWDKSRFMVVELKKDKITPQHVGQLQSYATWVRENIGKICKEVLLSELFDEELDSRLHEDFEGKVRIALVGWEFTEGAWSAIKSISKNKFLVDVFEFKRFFHKRKQFIEITRVYCNYD